MHMTNIPFADKATIAHSLDYLRLVEGLDKAFRANTATTPQRHHHDYQGTASGTESTLLLMPSWEQQGKLGIKLVTVSPDNHQLQLPAIHGLYVLFDSVTGVPQMLMDAQELTVRRTAAASALASKYLSREDSKTLLMVGTGALATHLIRAHASVRPIKKVMIWGRNQQKADALADSMQQEPFVVSVVPTIAEGLAEADIVSSATLSNTPLILGDQVVEGQHIDLVGSYKKDMREADDSTIAKSRVFVDTATAQVESGDLYMPLEQGLIAPDDIQGDLFKLCARQQFARRSDEEVTLFKSVGHAMEDLVAARLVWEAHSG